MGFDDLYEGIPLDEAASYFIKLKYGSVQGPVIASDEALRLFDSLSEEEKLACAEEMEKEAADIPSLDEYMAQEQQGMQAQNQGELEALRAQLRQAYQEMEMQQQSSQDAGMQAEQMQQQLAASNQTIQMAQQQAAMAQQQAMQTQQQQLAAADEHLRTQQMAAQMRTAYQELRGQLMSLATQDPAQSVGNELKGSPAEMGPSPMAAQLAPNSVPSPEGDAPLQQNAQGSSRPIDTASPVEEKTGARLTAGHAVGALSGAALGGLLANNEAINGPERHQANIAAMEANGGPKGFRQALMLAKEKAMLEYSKVNRQYPTAATIAGAGIGASMGFGAGEAVQGLMSNKLQEVG